MATCLSKLAEVEFELLGLRHDGRRIHRVVEPVRKIAVGKEVHAQHGGQDRQGPGGFGKVMEPLQQEHGDQGCPNLDAQGVFADAHETFNLEVLLEGFEEEFDLPAGTIDFGQRCSAKVQMVGQQDDRALVFFVPHHDASQGMRAFGWGVDAGKPDDFVGQDVAVLRDRPPLDDLVDGVFFHAGDEEDSLGNPRGKLLVMVVGAVHDDDGARGQAQQMQNFRIVSFGFRNQNEGGHVVVVVQEDMGFDAALGAPELRPWKQAQTQGHRGRIQREQFILEPELVLARAKPSLVAKPLHKRPEQFLEQCGGAVCVGIGQGGFVRGVLDAHMDELAHAAGQAVADFAQRVGVRELAEQHANELRPTGEPTRVTFACVLLDDARKFGSGNLFKKLTKQTGGLYHRTTLHVGVVNRFLRYPILQRRGRVVNSIFSKT